MSILSDADIASISKLLKKDISGWFKSNEGGSYLREFEKKFTDFLNAKHAVAVSSGSAAIYTALKACEVGLGDYVAVPGYTHVGSVAPIVLAGARPIFVDVNQYGNMSPEDLAAVVSVMKVKAVIARQPVAKSIFRFRNKESVHSFLKKRSAPNKTMRKDSMRYHENFCPDAHASNVYDWKCMHQLLRAIRALVSIGINDLKMLLWS